MISTAATEIAGTRLKKKEEEKKRKKKTQGGPSL